MHPAWQIEYAKLLVYLFKEHNCHILINTHSTEMIRAIEEFSKEENVDRFCNFYLSSKNKEGEGFNIENKNKSIEDIYEVLG